MEWLVVLAWGWVLWADKSEWVEVEQKPHEHVVEVQSETVEHLQRSEPIKPCGDVVYSTLGPSSTRHYYNEIGERCMAKQRCNDQLAACKADA